jgi:hypothetical protein
MPEERKKILEMLANGKISIDEAERLLSALSDEHEVKETVQVKNRLPKYLRVIVEPKSGSENGERVNVRVPINLIRAGLKLAAFIPKHSQSKVGDALKEKGLDLDFSKMTSEDLDELIENLNDLQVDVDGNDVVRVFCE